MGVMDVIDTLLIVLLGTTMFQAIRLQRAIGQLRAQRGDLTGAVAEFDQGARQAEASLVRLRETAQRLDREIGQAAALKDDLTFLAERGGEVADRLEQLVRSTRQHGLGQAAVQLPSLDPASSVGLGSGPVRSQAERDLLLALRGSR